MEVLELKQFWENVKEELIKALPENVHPWIYPLEVSGYDKGVLTVVTGQLMGRDLLRKNHLSNTIELRLRRHGQVVRQEPAKLLSPSSNLGVAFYFLP